MTDAKINFPFPHRELTLIDGRPNPQSLKKLFSEVYDNAFAVKSQAGGGQFGHLGAVMPAAQYIALDGTIAYVTPPDPGIQAPAPAAATAVQITQANRLYDSNVTRFETHNNVCLELKRMILAAVSDKYVSTLQHPLLRYAQVTVEALLQHLTDTYSEITQEVLENNRSKISAEWNPDDGIETIFTHITDAQQFAAAAGDDHIIPASTAMYLALTAIDNTGVFLEPCADWRKRHLAEQMLANFTADFTHAWKERNRRISAKAAGYQALLATKEEDKENISPAVSSKPDVNVDGIKMYYCWSHGLGFNSNHTSCTCKTKKDGHRDDATIRSRKGGSNIIWENNRNKK
jgi:hypothetical protein